VEVCRTLSIDEQAAIELASAALGIEAVSATRQPLGQGDRTTFKIDLADESSVALRWSPRRKTFVYTKDNLDILRKLALPVPQVMASGLTDAGQSYIILSWLPGRDLIDVLAQCTPMVMTRLAEQWVNFQKRVGKLPLGGGLCVFGIRARRRRGRCGFMPLFGLLGH
jgi:aminoglycoside phosphotransferase